MYYIAAICPPEVDAFVEQQKKLLHDRYGCKNALKSPAHITIIPPFWMDEGKQPELSEALRAFQFPHSAISVNLNGFSQFSHRTHYIQVEEQPLLGLLRQNLQEHLLFRMPGLFKTDERKFHPHVTLATRDIKPGEVEAELERLSLKGYRTSYVASELSLLRLQEGRWRVV